MRRHAAVRMARAHCTHAHMHTSTQHDDRARSPCTAGAQDTWSSHGPRTGRRTRRRGRAPSRARTRPCPSTPGWCCCWGSAGPVPACSPRRRRSLYTEGVQPTTWRRGRGLGDMFEREWPAHSQKMGIRTESKRDPTRPPPHTETFPCTPVQQKPHA